MIIMSTVFPLTEDKLCLMHKKDCAINYLMRRGEPLVV